MKRILVLTTLFALILSTQVVCAGDVTYPNQDTQKAFAQKFFDANAQGDRARYGFVNDVFQHGSEAEQEMWRNLDKGLTPDGSKKLSDSQKQQLMEEYAQQNNKPSGFMGDPKDPGPQDWSDTLIETDGAGNVTGFKPKDWYERDTDGDGEVSAEEQRVHDSKEQVKNMDKDGDGIASLDEIREAEAAMDTDGDGKVSDEERNEWNDKKSDERKNGPGSPGNVPPIAEWDKDQDGQPDEGFKRSCWQCCPGEEVLNECHYGAMGPCDEHACRSDQECVEHEEIHDDVSYICHNCKDEAVPLWCEDKGYSSDAACGGKCPPIACVPLDIDLSTGQIVPTNQTRERGSTRICYGCMNITEIEITYVIIIIETPYARYVLDQKGGKPFKPASVMALAKVDPSGKIQNTFGEVKKISGFLGGLNAGLGPMGLTSGGKISMDQLSSLLTSELSSSGGFRQNCFSEAAGVADKNAKEEGQPTSKDIEDGDIGESKKANAVDGPPVEKIQEAEAAGTPAVTGPVLACGEQDGEKVLKIYDSAGRLIDTVTKAMLDLNPDIITEKLGLAQQLSDMISSRVDVAGYLEKFTGLPVRKWQSAAARVAELKAKVDQSADLIKSKKKKKKKKKVEEDVVFPNDPLYFGEDGKKRKTPKVSMGSIVDFGDADRDATRLKVESQWGIQKVGFTPFDDPDSAWNVIDAAERNIVVAVIDSGLDLTHEDVPAFIWTNPKEIPGNGLDDDKNGLIDDVNGWNFLNENHDFTDVRGHGTFVAGIIAAKYNNEIGIAGINPGAVIMPIKVADDEGETDSLAVFRGINYAVDHGAKVINVSLGSRNVSKLEQQAIARAHQRGALVVVAAGNSNENISEFGPAASPNALAVGQIDYSGTRSTVSNWGPNLALVAPGEQIYSLCSKDNKHVTPSIREFGYYKQDGTSFAAPMVAATASLIWAKDPGLSNTQVRDLILATATDMEDPGWDAKTGEGLLNATAALRADVGGQVRVMVTNVRFNKDSRGRLSSVDVYGNVRGDVEDFVVETGKGSRANRFQSIAGPFQGEYDHQWITRISEKDLRGSDEWILRLNARGSDGREYVATTPLKLP